MSETSGATKMEGNREEEGQNLIQDIQAQLVFAITKHKALVQELQVLDSWQQNGPIPPGRAHWIRQELKNIQAHIVSLDRTQKPLLKKLGLLPQARDDRTSKAPAAALIPKLEVPDSKFQVPLLPPSRGLEHRTVGFRDEKIRPIKAEGGHIIVKNEMNFYGKSRSRKLTSGSSEPGSCSGWKLESRTRSMGRRGEGLGEPKPVPPPVHPSLLLSQEEYLSSLGLVTHEVARKRQMEPKKIERRRRTTANPKYNFNSCVERGGSGGGGHLNPKRPRRTDSESSDRETETSKKKKTIESCQNQPALICYVCEQQDCNLTCENCTTKYHADCIRLTASKAPIPSRLVICPKCVRASNPPPAHRVMKPVSSRPPSIMSPSSQNKSQKITLTTKEESSGSRLNSSEKTKANPLNKITVGPMGGGVVKSSSSIVSLNIPRVRSYPKLNPPVGMATVNPVEIVPRDSTQQTDHNSVQSKDTGVVRQGLNLKRLGPAVTSRNGIKSLKWNRKTKLRKIVHKVHAKRLKASTTKSAVEVSDTAVGATRESESQTSFTPPTSNAHPLVKTPSPPDQVAKGTNGHFSVVNNSSEDCVQNDRDDQMDGHNDPSTPSNQKECKNGAKGKICNGAPKIVKMTSFSVKKTILAMTAAAKSVMSNVGIKIPQPLTTSVNHQNQDLPVSKVPCPESMDSISAIIEYVVKNKQSDDPNKEDEVLVSKPKKLKDKPKPKKCKPKSCVKIPITKQKNPVPKIVQDKVQPGLLSGEFFDSVQTETEPTTPASTIPLLSPVESRSSGDCLPRMTLSMMSSELSSSSSSDHRSECEESDVLLSLSNSPKSCFNESEGVEGNNQVDAPLTAEDMEKIYQLRESVIDLKNQLSDQRELKAKLLSEEQGVRDRIRQMHKFIECFRLTFPEIPIPPHLFDPPEPFRNLPSP